MKKLIMTLTLLLITTVSHAANLCGWVYYEVDYKNPYVQLWDGFGTWDLMNEESSQGHPDWMMDTTKKVAILKEHFEADGKGAFCACISTKDFNKSAMVIGEIESIKRLNRDICSGDKNIQQPE